MKRNRFGYVEEIPESSRRAAESAEIPAATGPTPAATIMTRSPKCPYSPDHHLGPCVGCGHVPASKEILWFRRSDGVLYCAEDGSELARQMSADGSFARCDPPAGNAE